MSNANASMTIDVLANTAVLGQNLQVAEGIVDRSANRMAKSVDGRMVNIMGSIGNKLAAAFGGGMLLNALDGALKKVAEGIKDSKSVADIGQAIGEGLLETLRKTPIAGALMDLTAAAADPLFGGPMSRDRAVREGQAGMARIAAGQAAEAAMRSVGQAVDPIAQMRAQAEAEKAEVLRQLEIAQAGAHRELKIPWYEQMSASFHGRKPTETYESREEKMRLGTEAAKVRDEIDRRLAQRIQAFEAEQRAQEMAGYERSAAEERKRKEESRRAVQETNRLNEEAAEAARVKAEQDYENFVEGNRRDAIMALEGQLSALTAAGMPTREERLREIMGGMTGGVATGDTALGAFSFAVGDAAEISRNILATANDQLKALERIEALQAEIRDLSRGTGFN